MKTSIELDEATMAEVETTATLIREKPATIIRLAVRAGLPLVANRFQAPRPEGYFADAYKKGARVDFEEAMGKATIQRAER
jgi:hypothetical protein